MIIKMDFIKIFLHCFLNFGSKLIHLSNNQWKSSIKLLFFIVEINLYQPNKSYLTNSHVDPISFYIWRPGGNNWLIKFRKLACILSI